MLVNPSFLRGIALGSIFLIGASQTPGQQTVRVSNDVPQVRQYLQQAPLADLRRNQVLGITTTDCSHVIDLLMQNQLRSRFGSRGTEQLHLPHLSVGLNPGDLQLVSVRLVCDGDHLKGPVFQIGMRNCSNVPIGNFHVSLVGVLGRITPSSPSATICIPRMEAGEETHIQVQLPLDCMSMGPLHQPCAFDTLIVALDSHDVLLECDELNNVQVLRRAEIGMLTPVVEDVSAAPVSPVQPAPNVAPVPAPQKPSPLDGIDLDNLDPGDLDQQNEMQSLRFPQ